MKTNKKGHFTPPHLRNINYPLLFFILFAGTSLAACYDDNNISPLWAVVSDHEQRLSDLEEWQDQVNRNIASLQQLLNTTDYITAVTPLMEGGQEVGYTITFLNSDPINIYHGAQGDEGDKGEPGEQGDAFFADDPKLSDDGTHYTFTLSDDDNTDLSDNPTFKVPVYQAFSLGTGVLELNPGTTEIEITLPAGTTADDYRALVAQITPEGEGGTFTDISTRADNAADWSVEGDLQGKKVTVTAEATAQVAKALLRVTLIRNDGSEVTASCILGLSYRIENGDTYTVYTPKACWHGQANPMITTAPWPPTST